MKTLLASTAIFLTFSSTPSYAEIDPLKFALDGVFWMDAAKKCGLPSKPFEDHINLMFEAKGVDTFERMQIRSKMNFLLAMANNQTTHRPCSEVKEWLEKL